MIVALALAAALATPAPADEAGRVTAVRDRYETLYRLVTAPRILDPQVREALIERSALGARLAGALAAEPQADVLADLERRAELDETAVGALLDPRSAGTPTAAPGAHVGVVRAGARDTGFAYWVPAGYDSRHPGPLVVLFHGAIQPETDLVARAFFRDLADASGAVILAPGGDDRKPDEMAASLEAAERVLHPAVAWDPARRYVGGFSNGVFDAFHAIAIQQREPCAGFLGIAGFMLPADADGVGMQLSGRRAVMVSGAADKTIPTATVRKVVSMLLARQVDARLESVPNAGHSLRALYPAIAGAWREVVR
jgi:hypothetical protein